MSKKELTEEDIKLRYITPAINSAGWKNEHIRMEYYFTDGRGLYSKVRYMHARQERKLIISWFHASTSHLLLSKRKTITSLLEEVCKQAMEIRSDFLTFLLHTV